MANGRRIEHKHAGNCLMFMTKPILCSGSIPCSPTYHSNQPKAIRSVFI